MAFSVLQRTSCRQYKAAGGGYSGKDPRKGMMGYKTAPIGSDSNNDMLKRQVS